VVGFLRRLNLV